MEAGEGTAMGTLDIVGSIESDGTVYKIVEFQPGSGELQVEQLGAHHHLAATEDGTLVHVRTTVDGTSQSVPIRFHHHGTEEAATLLRLQDFAAQDELLQAGGEEAEEPADEQDVKLLAQHRTQDDESQDEASVVEQQESEQQQYLQLFTAQEHDGLLDESGQPVEIHLNMSGTPSMDLHSIISGTGISVSEGLTYEQHDPSSAGGLHLSGKVKEPSTAAALDLGCEWSLTLPFGFQGQALNEQCQKLILNVWHYFKHLKKYPELVADKNAQGLAGDALNVGTKTIGRIGKAFRTGKLQEIQEYKNLQQKKRKRSQSASGSSKVREVLKGRKLKKSTGAAESEEDEQHDSFMDEQEDDSSAGPSGGRGRAKARGGTTGTGSRAPAARGGRGAPSAARGGRGGKKMVQTTLPVNVKAVYGSKASTSAHQFDSSD